MLKKLEVGFRLILLARDENTLHTSTTTEDDIYTVTPYEMCYFLFFKQVGLVS